ncbi:hypothetical protein TNCV_2135501 [Trichonephila clavipes]|nr:hypothetical protein TNCV_2135501 [Trichonephila clavipes]
MVDNHRIVNIPHEDPDVICLTVDHSNLLTTPSRANRYINERLSLKSHLYGSVPHLSFGVRGKLCHLAQGGLVKRSDQRKIFEKLGLFAINLEMLPHFRDDRTLPDHLHDEVHEDISECTMVYRFARYL